MLLVEHWEGKVDSITLQLVAFGRRVAEQIGVEVVAAALGHQLDGVVAALQASGLDRIVTVDDPALALP